MDRSSSKSWLDDSPTKAFSDQRISVRSTTPSKYQSSYNSSTPNATKNISFSPTLSSDRSKSPYSSSSTPKSVLKKPYSNSPILVGKYLDDETENKYDDDELYAEVHSADLVKTGSSILAQLQVLKDDNAKKDKTIELISKKNEDLLQQRDDALRAKRVLNDEVKRQADEYQKMIAELNFTVKNLKQTSNEQSILLEQYQREAAQNKKACDRLQDQVEQQNRQYLNEIKSKNDVIDHLRNELSTSEYHKQSKIKEAASLSTQNSELEEKIHALQLVVNEVTDLKQQNTVLPLLKQDVAKLKQKNAQLKSDLEQQKATNAQLLDQKIHTEALNEHISKELQEQREANSYLKLQVEQLEDKKRQIEFLQKELDHYKLNIVEQLKEEARKFNRQQESKNRKLGYSVKNLSTDLNQITNYLDLQNHTQKSNLSVQLSGDDYSQMLVLLASISDTSSGSQVSLFDVSVLRTRALEVIQNIYQLRDIISTLQTDIESLQNQLNSKEGERERTFKELLQVKEEVIDLQKTVSGLEENKEKLMSQIVENETIIEKLEHEKQLFLINVDTVLGSISTQLSPSKTSGIANSLESIFIRISSYVNDLQRERDSLKRDVMSLELSNEEVSKQLSVTKQQLTQAWEKSEKMKKDLEQKRTEELELQRQQLEQVQETMVKQSHQKQKHYEKMMTELHTQIQESQLQAKKASINNEGLRKEIKELNSEKDKLFGSLKLLMRIVRPMKRNIQELRYQKQIALTLLKHSNHHLKEVHSVAVEQLTSNYMPEVRKTSLRGAVIAIIAYNRFVKINKNPHKNIVFNIGNEKLYLLPSHDVKAVEDIPFSIYPESNNADSIGHQVLQLCSLFDPMFEESNKDDRLLRSLHQGFYFLRNLDVSFILSHETKEQASVRIVKQILKDFSRQYRETRRAKVVLEKRISELNLEIQRLNQHANEIEQAIEKKEDLIAYMDQKISKLQDESIQMIPNEKYIQLQKEYEKTRSSHNELLKEKQNLKREHDGLLSLSEKLKIELSDLRNRLKNTNEHMQVTQDELSQKHIENIRLQNQIKELREQNLEVEQEKKKFQYLVNEMQIKLFSANDDESVHYSQSLDDSMISEKSNSSPASKLLKSLAESSSRVNRNVDEIDRDILFAKEQLSSLSQMHSKYL